MNAIKLSPRSALLALLGFLLISGAGGSFVATADYLQCAVGGPCPAGTARDDIILGTDGDDAAAGGAGNDQVLGGPGDDALAGDAGNDFLDGGAGDDSLTGGDGNDIIDGGPGVDTIDGGDGNDKINIEPGDVPTTGGPEVIVCGTGTDTVNFIGFGPLTFNQPATPIAVTVTDPVTGGTYTVSADCERINGLTQAP